MKLYIWTEGFHYPECTSVTMAIAESLEQAKELMVEYRHICAKEDREPDIIMDLPIAFTVDGTLDREGWEKFLPPKTINKLNAAWMRTIKY